MRRLASFVTITLLASGFSALPVKAEEAFYVNFSAPIDAISITITEEREQAVSAWMDGTWTPWQELALENEQDPSLRESNLVMLPQGTTTIRFASDIPESSIHPVRVSSAPAQFTVAAAGDTSHKILARREWGADESLIVSTTTGAQSAPADLPAEKGDNGNGGESSSPREQDCMDAHAKFAGEFQASTAVTENTKGEKLRWPLQYSPSVRLLVVHHTAIVVTGDARSGLERMRALYQYHAANRGWGDIGYHFIIDERGQIYEGRSGGDSVVGGHVYCNNVGTIGVAMMGNFDREQPTQAQTQSLQWLLKLLGEKYAITMTRDVVFHGKRLPTIVGHRQLVSTDCPGLVVWGALDHIRDNVRTGAVDAAVTFPDIPALMQEEPTVPAETIITGSDGLASLGTTVIEGRPGGDVILSIFFRAGRKSYKRNTRIARVTRSRGVDLWQERDGAFVPIRGDIRMPVPLLKQGQSVVLRVKVRLPLERGEAALKIGSLNYTFSISGKRLRTPQLINSNAGRGMLSENPAPVRAVREPPSQSNDRQPQGTQMIRILLTPDLPMAGLSCEGISIQRETVGGLTRVTGYFRSPRSYRGTVECRMMNGAITLINELSLEDYLAGLAEEPDSELYEKQRAFAIAARTYALFYMDPANRKFPGMPYDGSDNPATFQLYRGVEFENTNPGWLRAVKNTAGHMLTYRNEVIKPAYFSSDDGRTRTPAEAGWKNFPAAEIFTSKDDPWCAGMPLHGHGVGMSGCGAKGQAAEGKTAEQILHYYYPGTVIDTRQ